MASRTTRSRKSRKTNQRPSNARRYADCRPHAPCATGSDDMRSYSGTIGGVVSGFDHYGYPIIRNMKLPAPFAIKQGRQYGAASNMIRPMRLVAVGPNGEVPKPKPGLARTDIFRLKPSPSVPAAPGSLPSKYKFCLQKGEHGYFFRFRNAKTALHGSEAEVLDCHVDANGLTLCKVKLPNTSSPYEAPLCEEPGADKEPVPPDCCVKILGDTSAQILCPGSSYDLLIVEIVTTGPVGGIMIASVKHPDIPGGGVRLPICEPMDEAPEERVCCIEEKTGLIVCPEGVNFPLAGMKIPLNYLVFVTEADGSRVARLKCGDIMEIAPSARADDEALDAMWTICEQLGGYIFPVCEQKAPRLPPPVIRTPPRKPPKPPRTPPVIRHPDAPPPVKVPDICCYDPKTGKLVCEGTKYHGLKVDVVTQSEIGGIVIVSVESDKLPGRGARVPLCPPSRDIPRLPPAECCVIESSSGLTLLCTPEDHPWNHKDVTAFGSCADLPNGRMCALVWEDEYGKHTLEVPVCPPPPEVLTPPGGTAPTPERPPEGVPRLPTPTRPPADGCDTVEGNRCRQVWDEMVTRPAKMTKCDKKWLKLLKKLREQKCGQGHRASMMENHKAKSRRYGMGIPAESREYARFPGLRGGRNIA